MLDSYLLQNVGPNAERCARPISSWLTARQGLRPPGTKSHVCASEDIFGSMRMTWLAIDGVSRGRSWSSMTWLDRTSFTAMAPSAGTKCRSMEVWKRLSVFGLQWTFTYARMQCAVKSVTVRSGSGFGGSGLRPHSMRSMTLAASQRLWSIALPRRVRG